jgi:2-keto-3-deoxy-L-rhamnonate aldolase RhmA/quercetin dioxygenase-like cupin family protein
MKTEALRNFRKKLSDNETVYGLWVTLESASITEIGVASGMDWIVIDAEHGHLDWADIVNHIRAAIRSNTVILVRIAELQEGLIKRVLDIGADGVVIPHIETPEELTRAISFSKYPPAGTRGIGAERATGWGQCFIEHVTEANDAVLVVPIIESLRGGDNIISLLEVPGTDVFFFGPADYAASAGFAGQWEVPEVTRHMNNARDEVLKAGKHCGVVTTSIDDLARRNEEGFHMLAYGIDAALLIRSIRQISAALGRDRKITPDFSVPAATGEFLTKPEGYETDRDEKISKVGEGQILNLAPGVVCEALVGRHINSNNLFTAIVTFDAGNTALPYHTHPHAESITLLSGKGCIEVEDRRYILSPLDNITIPAGYAHLVKNISDEQAAVFHIAMPVDFPQRNLVEQATTEFRDIPDNFNGHIGPERVTRADTAYRYPSGPGTEFIDFFNDSLIPGIGMSGGYALFYEGGRLPAHLHDFDESICIVEGQATCFVEGRKYMMSDLATALQPRGKIHYFINQLPEAMAMIWVYAGAMPVRTEVDDSYADA